MSIASGQRVLAADILALQAAAQTAGQVATAVAAAIAAARRYVVGFQMVGTQASASQIVALHTFATAVSFPANLGAISSGEQSEGKATAVATAAAAFTFDHCPAASDPTNPANWSTIATLTVPLGGYAAALATTGGVAQSVAQGDMGRLAGPVAPDTTLANFAGALVGFG
jgi:hypothetical protein